MKYRLRFIRDMECGLALMISSATQLAGAE